MTTDTEERVHQAIERAAQHLYENHTGNTWDRDAITAAAWRRDARKALAAVGLLIEGDNDE